jgi:Domain of unknown function (DUF6471)
MVFTIPNQNSGKEMPPCRLREMGLEETKVSIASKLSRGGFGATFFIATMKAIGRETVNISEV